LEGQGVLLDALAEEVGRELDPFDLICHVAYGQPPLTRRKRDYFARFGEQARAVLEALLDKYADEGLAPLEDIGVLRVQPLNHFGTPLEIVKLFGDRDKFLEAVRDLKAGLYEAAA
jgi:type I restriction enzyme R subunit